MKRAISLLLSLSMVFTMAAPVFAEGSTSAAIELPAVTQETTSVPEETTSVPEETTSVPEETTSVPEETTSAPEEATSVPEEATSVPEESTSVPEEDAVDSEETVSPLAAEPVAAPEIPGYTLVTSTSLNTNSYYLIVALDSDGTAYALYADADKKSVGAGASILDDYVAPGTFAAKLNIAADDVTANREITGNPAVDVNALRFTTEKNAGGFAFKSVNGLYLNVLANGMLSDKPVSFSLSKNANNSFVIKNSEDRTLDFNKLGDPNQFVGKPGLKTNTNFWGPAHVSNTKLPIYLYTQNNQPVNPDAPAVALGENMSEMFNKNDANNTWMFDGGVVTQGSVKDLNGARSYVYQFEEYIRWTQASIRDEWVTRHRFVFNVGKAGQTLADSLAKFDDRASKLDPRAAAYLIGKEDCQAGAAGIDAFKANLTEYIKKALNLRSNTGFAVIQTPYPSVANGELYAAAAREVVKSLDSSVIGHVQLVDHFASTNWDSAYVNANGNLTDRGHFELGKQFSEATFGSSVKYPADSVPANFPQLSYVNAPSRYSKDAATVTAGANSLSVVLPSGISAVTYELKTDSYTLTGTATESNFTIADLPANTSYTLTMTTTDGQTRLPVMVGTVTSGTAATVHTFTVNSDLANRMASGKPMTWMFMGDSITHGAYHTCGYDSISQLFEKFLRDDLGRTDDLVLNTAVSSAATADTVRYLNERLNKYQPDVVFLMLGANCTGEGNAYKSNLDQIVTAAQNKGATVILRTPVCKESDATKGGISFSQQAEMMRQVATEKGCLLIDQNPVWGNELKKHPYLASKLFNNDLHPNALGHIWMFRMLLEGTGLAKDDSFMYNLAYDLGTTQTDNATKPFVKVENNTATLDTAALATSTSLNFSEVTLTATEEATGLSYSVTVKGGTPAVLNNLPAGKTFTFKITAQQKNANTIVNFVGTTDSEEIVDPLKIPGYTRVTSGELDPTKYYLVVGKDSSNNLFALYPDAKGLTASAGNAISESVAPNGVFASQLNINGSDVTSTHLSDNQAIAMDDLRFTVTKSGSQYAFAGSNGNCISLGDKLLSSAPTNLSVTLKDDGSVQIENDSNGRILDFNKHGDPNEFVNNGNKFNTNFWAPYARTKFPVYLYTQDNATVPVTVNKNELKSAISRAEGMMSSDVYSAESKASLKTVLDAAKAENSSTSSTVESVAKATQDLVRAMQAMAPVADKIAAGAPANGKTEGQPFPKGLAGSDTFRIPAITTLDNGWLAAAIDARWDHSPDGDNIDTLFSISKDNGKTWEYTFPNFFNDSTNFTNDLSTAFIDPVMVQGKDGTIYLMVDLFPAGHYIGSVERVTGYEEIDKVQRLVLYTSLNGHNHNNYAYYVGDFKTAKGETKAFAPVIAKGDKDMTPVYYVDDHYYLYTADKAPMYCPQLASDKYVQQNVFFYNADLHVRNATYLWLVTSKDYGQTWSAPTIMNPMVRPAKGGTTHAFYGVGPGAGLTLEDGTVMLPCYTHSPEKSSFIYTRDNGQTWHRSEDATTGLDWSSENALVQIDNKTVRQFCRDGYGVLRYTDHVWNGSEWVRNGAPVRLNDVPKTSANQLSAIRYSEPINGQTVIMVSTAATGSNARQNGKIYALALNDDKTMSLISSYEVTKPGVTYGYSSLTQQKDGSIGLLYEDTFIHGTYLNIPLNKIIPNAVVDGKRVIDVPLYGTYEDTFTPAPTAEDLKTLDSSIVTTEIKDGKVTFTGVKEGTTSFTSNGVTAIVNVVPVYPTEQVNITCRGEHKVRVSANPVIVNHSDVITTSLEPIIVTGGQGTTGTDKNYNGKAEALASALYTFHKDGEGFQVSALDANGTMTWVDPTAGVGFPFTTQATSVKFVPQDNGTFFLLGGESRYLYFWPNRKNQYTYDAVSKTEGFVPGCSFKLYRPVNENETSSTELPGYVATTEIKDGGKYLIVSQVGSNSFVMRPSTDGSSRYSHVLKADPNAEKVTTTVENVLTFKAQGKAGTANVLVDGTVYQVTVEHKLTRVERVEPTASKPGNILYWHCEICGKNFLDAAGTQPVDNVVIPAGTPLVPIEPSTPVTPENPSQPDNNTSDNNSSNNAAAPATPAPTAAPVGRVPTGDNANLGLWLAVIVLAGAGIGGITYLRKRKGDKQ